MKYNEAMYLRRCQPSKSQKEKIYWQLVESYRSERGPRQRVVAYLGDTKESLRLGIKEIATGRIDIQQTQLFRGTPEVEWVEVDPNLIRVERVRDFGGYWFGLQVLEKLGINRFLAKIVGQGHEEISWNMMVLTLVLMRLCEPSSELRIAEELFEQSALGDLLGIPVEKINDDRLYRSLDILLPHKAELEKYLKERLGELFNLEYDLLFYDITSTYFEGESQRNNQAKHGYSRDHRPDCRQVCIALVVSHWGLPLGYEVFAGNRFDATTVEEMVNKIESQYGQANRIWVMDRGMVSEDNLKFLKSGGRRYIVGTPRSQLKRFDGELLSDDWQKVHEGLEVKLCPGEDGQETFILCRSAARAQKEKAMHDRFERRIEDGLAKLVESCNSRKQKVGTMERRVGRLLEANSRAGGLFKIEVKTREDGSAILSWEKVVAWREWASLSEGCYMLRTNIKDWDGERLWHAYIQLTEAEAAFRIHKSDLTIRPIWHQKTERVQAHILVCFLAYVAWKTIGQMCNKAGLGDEPRRIFAEISKIKMVDVVLPTKSGTEIRRRCVAQPTKYQSILLDRLGLHLPKQLDYQKL
jgi:transposase